MWIQTQSKQQIVNTDQVTDIFINNTGTSIIAHVSMPNDTRMIYLGEYENRDTCLKILNCMSVIIGITGKIPGIAMPLGEQIEEWTKCMEDLAQAFVIRDLLK